MARIQIIDVPPAPKADAVYLGEARGGEISAPGVRYQEATNFEKHIGGLMQPELSQAPYANLARAQSGIGAAIADAGQNLAGTMMQLAQGMKESKDASDISFANNTMRLTHAEFAERVANENIQPAQQLEVWEQEYKPKINQALIDRQMSPEVINEIGPKWQLFNRQTRVGIAQQAQQELIKAQEAEIVNDLDASVQSGDWEGALDANSRLTLGHHQTPGQEAKRKRDILDAKQEWDLQQDIGRDPRIVLEEMREIQATGKSDIYPDLKNPIIVNKYEKIAANAVNDKTAQALQEVQTAKEAGQIKKPEDIDRILGRSFGYEFGEGPTMRGGTLTEMQIAGLKNEQLHDPPYDPEAAITMKTKIGQYNSENDPDMREFNRLYLEIGQTVPQRMQGALRADLNEEYQRKRDGKPKDEKKELKSAAQAEVLKFANAGAFDPEGYSEEKFKENPLKYRTQRLEVWSKVESIQKQISTWIDENPDKANETTVRQQLGELLQPGLSQKASKDWRDINSGYLPDNPIGRTLMRFFGLRFPGYEGMAVPAQEIREKIPAKLTPGPQGTSSSWRYATPEEEKANQGKGPNWPDGIEGDDMSRAPGAINDNLISAVKQFEGFAQKAQWDFKQWSVGYGTKGKQGETLTPAQAEARLRSELAFHAGKIDDAADDVGLRLTQGQRDALISFDFNTGKGDYLIRSSKGNVAEIVRRLKLYVKAGGKTLPGLVNRRKAEAEMFLT